MEHRIIHACGHEQAHFIPGYLAQRERKARWLRTTACRACFAAGRRAEAAEATGRYATAIAALAMVELTGSERQVAWAAGIRARRLAALIEGGEGDRIADHSCLSIADARWWIDGRELSDTNLLARAEAPDAPAQDRGRVAVAAVP